MTTVTKPQGFDDIRSDDLVEMLSDPASDANGIAFDLADAITEALEKARDLTPSAAARKVGCSRSAAWIVLGWLVDHQYAHTSGNGAWTHYHPGRR